MDMRRRDVGEEGVCVWRGDAGERGGLWEGNASFCLACSEALAACTLERRDGVVLDVVAVLADAAGVP